MKENNQLIHIVTNDDIYEGVIVAFDYLWLKGYKSQEKHYVVCSEDKGIIILSENEIEEVQNY